MKNIKKFLIFLAVFSIFILPVFSFAAFDPLKGLIPCGGATGGVTPVQKCDFTAFLTLINNLIDFALVNMAVPIAAVMFVYAGFELVTSGGSMEKRGTAKNIFTNAVLGLAVAAAAWIIVKWILTILAPGVNFFLA